MFGLHPHPSELLPPIPRPVRRLLRLCDHVMDIKTDPDGLWMRLECLSCGHPSRGWDLGRIEPPSLPGSPVARRLERRRAMRMTRAAQ